MTERQYMTSISYLWEISIRYPAKLRKAKSKPKKVKKLWKECFEVAMALCGIEQESVEILWDELAYGNWGRLHQTEEETKRTADEWFDDFINDVLYCSDRWSIDRITRCHWQYRQWMDTQEVDDD